MTGISSENAYECSASAIPNRYLLIWK